MGVSGYVFVDAGDFPTEALRALGVPPFIAKNEPLSKAAAGACTSPAPSC